MSLAVVVERGSCALLATALSPTTPDGTVAAHCPRPEISFLCSWLGLGTCQAQVSTSMAGRKKLDTCEVWESPLLIDGLAPDTSIH